ncbi:hypothetical protein ACFQ0B_28695 [Nonomuraea thailandensis]
MLTPNTIAAAAPIFSHGSRHLGAGRTAGITSVTSPPGRSSS